VAAEVDRDLLEWNYGSYEGRTSVDINAERPDWLLFRDGCPIAVFEHAEPMNASSTPACADVGR
jgi:broad specificity phosphatase PhoE